LVRGWAEELGIPPPRVEFGAIPFPQAVYDKEDKTIYLGYPYIEAWLRDRELGKIPIKWVLAHEFRHHMLREAGIPYGGVREEIGASVWATKWTGITKGMAARVLRTILPDLFGIIDQIRFRVKVLKIGEKMFVSTPRLEDKGKIGA